MMKRFAHVATLALSILAMAAPVFAASNGNTANSNANVSPAEREKIEAVVHDYLLRQPEVLIEAMQVLQRKQFEQQQQTVQQTQKIATSFAKDLFHKANDPIAGNPDGTITLVEFFDYQCPHCIEMTPIMEGIIKANPNLRVVYKEFPIRGPLSEFAARAALAANKQGKYVAFNHALMTANAPLTEASILKIARDVGLNLPKLKQDMEDNSVKEQINANDKLAQNLKLFGTPAMFVGKTTATGSGLVIYYIPGKVADQNQLQQIIDKVK